MSKSSKMICGSYPSTRLRRNRRDAWSRKLVSEHSLNVSDLILPIFVTEGENISEDIPSMTGVKRHSIDILIKEVKIAKELGIPAIAIFPVICQNLKTQNAEESYNKNNLICRATSAIKNTVPDIGVICDVALDPYTSHGQDGIVKDDHILNDETVEVLCKQSVAQALAGCDIIAPSDMMDGRIGKIRNALDEHGFSHVRILSYSAKYASCFYGPFRDAVGSAPNIAGGGKHTYQMDCTNTDEALREVAFDIEEGADMVIVKPGMPYLDIISRISENFCIPVFAYQVSGEYAMIKAASENGWLDGNSAMYESLVSFKRAGATGILTYAAIEMAKFIRGEKNE